MANVVIPTHGRASEIAVSQTFLAPRRWLSYTYGVMLNFAYGSNINLDHLHDFLDTHGVTPDTESRGQHALLHNYRLRTNYFASSHRAGACNIEPSMGECVEGVIRAITPAIQDALRLKEGFPLRYHEIEVIVRTASTQGSVRAITYMVTSTQTSETYRAIRSPGRSAY